MNDPDILIDFVDRFDAPLDGVKGRTSVGRGRASKFRHYAKNQGHRKKRRAIKRMVKGGRFNFRPTTLWDID